MVNVIKELGVMLISALLIGLPFGLWITEAPKQLVLIVTGLCALNFYVFMWAFFNDECGGDCGQGRKSCDCKGDWK